ncbi:MAG: nucleotidyltransferase family protein [Planctomycetota bacterium]|nr:nucleotidyltransferase family protein [Planctomycetota bacterium]
MSPTQRLDPYREPLARLCERFGVHWLAAFGSVLRDDFGEDSDVDLLVEFLPETHVGLFHLIRLQNAIEELLGRPVDLVPRDGLKPLIRDQVLATSEQVYAA